MEFYFNTLKKSDQNRFWLSSTLKHGMLYVYREKLPEMQGCSGSRGQDEEHSGRAVNPGLLLAFMDVGELV